MVILQYWEDARVEPVAAFAKAERTFGVPFPVRIYPIVWTPALGVQHVLPSARLAVFAAGRSPALVRHNYGRLCCQAPQAGPYPVEVRLALTPTIDPAREYEVLDIIHLLDAYDELDRLLSSARGLTPEDRQVVRAGLDRLVTAWRSVDLPRDWADRLDAGAARLRATAPKQASAPDN
jgi:hypothetical protein